jgi:hypothetical protein
MGMCHGCETRDIRMEVWSKYHLEDLDTDVRTILKLISRKLAMV